MSGTPAGSNYWAKEGWGGVYYYTSLMRHKGCVHDFQGEETGLRANPLVLIGRAGLSKQDRHHQLQQSIQENFWLEKSHTSLDMVYQRAFVLFILHLTPSNKQIHVH